MASSKRDQKDRFFADLSRLDQESEDSDEDSFERPTITTTSQSFSSSSTATKKRKAFIGSHRGTPPSALPSSSVPSRQQAITPSNKRPKTTRQVSPLTRASSRSSDRKQHRRGMGKPQEVVPEGEQFFREHKLFFIPNNQEHTLRKRQINMAIARGAEWAREWTSSVTHVVVFHDLDITEASRELPARKLPPDIPVVRDRWIVECFGGKICMDLDRSRFYVKGMKSPFELAREHKTEATKSTRTEDPANSPDSGPPKSIQVHAEASGNELDQAVRSVQQLAELPDVNQFMDFDSSNKEGTLSGNSDTMDEVDDTLVSENEGFQCMQRNDGKEPSPNIRTMVILQEMANRYDRIGDTFRCLAYRRAITALRQQTEVIRTLEDAVKITGIGTSIAEKIEEISSTDRLRKLEFALADCDEKRLKLFMGVYGCGWKQASKWIAQGYRTLEDLRIKADLTPSQKIGVEHYDDFATRIPREEVKQHAVIVQRALQSADFELRLIVGGSFRRGNEDSGDIDILITKQGASLDVIRTIMNDTVMPQLTRTGFLTAELATSHPQGDGSKWHGACALPGSSVWRRLDLLFVPSDELGAALIYFTGNDIFNRSIRLLASRKGMRLNQHGLYRDVMRGKGRVKLTQGNLLEGKSEERIFELLGVPYRPPEHRKP